MLLNAQRSRFRGLAGYSLGAFAARGNSSEFPLATREASLYSEFFDFFQTKFDEGDTGVARFGTRPQPPPKKAFDRKSYVLPGLNGLSGHHFGSLFASLEVLDLTRAAGGRIVRTDAYFLGADRREEIR